MNSPSVLVVSTGCANLASVRTAFQRLNVEVVLSTDPARVESARAVVLPGVGHFSEAMAALRAHDLDEAIAARFHAGRPLLAICLGLQMLCTGSEEAPGVPGLGLLQGQVDRFTPAARVPQMGWNDIVPSSATLLLKPAAMYFANSYRLAALPSGWIGAMSAYGGSFVAALERGPILACQFHPELSGSAGQALLRRWLATTFAQEMRTC